MDMIRMSRAAKRAMEQAEREALALGHARLEPAHVLLGLLLEPGAAQVALSKAGVEAPKLRRKVDAAYDGPRIEGKGGKARDLERGGLLREVLETARDTADSEGEQDILAVRLFLAVTEGVEDEEEGRGAVGALAALGVDVEAVREAARALAHDEAQGSLPSA